MIKKIKQNKTLLSLAALIITLLLIIVVRITYAFLKAKIGEEAQANIHLDVEKLYAIEFVPGSDLNLSVNSKTLTENVSITSAMDISEDVIISKIEDIGFKVVKD